MYPPVDYPVADESSSGDVVAQMTYAALLEKHDAQECITPDMIQSASLSMEAAQHMPLDEEPRKYPNMIAGNPMLKRLLNLRG